MAKERVKVKTEPKKEPNEEGEVQDPDGENEESESEMPQKEDVESETIRDSNPFGDDHEQKDFDWSPKADQSFPTFGEDVANPFDTTEIDQEKEELEISESNGEEASPVTAQDFDDPDDETISDDENSEPDHVLDLDEDSHQFFLFGVEGSGKTVLIASLLYYLKAFRLGDQVSSLNREDVLHEVMGYNLQNDLMEMIEEGKWPASTSLLQSESTVFPRLIKCEYKNKDTRLPKLKFSLMDVSGEDLRRIKATNERGRSKLSEGIEAFMDAPSETFAAICLFPTKSGVGGYAQLTTYITAFLDKLEKKGKGGVPVMFIASKWDLVEAEYPNGPAKFLQENAPIIWSRLQQDQRPMAFMGYSIGKVHEDSSSMESNFKFMTDSPERLFQWMYHATTGQELNPKEENTPGRRWLNILRKR